MILAKCRNVANNTTSDKKEHKCYCLQKFLQFAYVVKFYPHYL